MALLLLLMVFNPEGPFPNSVATVASWYGSPFHGRETASGLPYDMYDTTVASCALPLGTLIDIQCPETGVIVRNVRVIDRGPYAVDSEGNLIRPIRPHPIRGLDLSMQLADSLSCGELDNGLYTVQYWIIGYDDTEMFDYD